MTTREVARSLGVTTRTVRRWKAAGELVPDPNFKRRAEHLFRRKDVEALRDRRRLGLTIAELMAGAGAYLARSRAESSRPLCPTCARREVNHHGDFCTPCEDERQGISTNRLARVVDL
jgi:DNA-binding transcriptional MerR regulator